MRTVLISGGGRGIGRAIASRFCAGGDRVVIAEIDDDLGRAAARGLGATFVHADVALEPDVVRAVDAAGENIDVVVHNAGIGAGAPVAELSLEAWNRVVAVNLTAAFLLAKHAYGRMRGGGSIALIASTRALQSERDTEAYAASKGGLVALAHSLAVSLGSAVRVNAVSPGWIHHGAPSELTDADHAQHPAGRAGVPADIAELVWFLASDAAGFITGQNIVADGGMTKRMRYV